MKNDGFAELLNYPEQDAQLGGLVGLLLGDALGVPYEYHLPECLPERHQVDMLPPADFPRSHQGVPPGTWSDDGAQALCLLASLLERGRLSLPDFSSKLVRWFNDGYMAVDGQVFDCGIQTANAIDKLRRGIAPERSGGSGERDNGNGSLMRALPLALWHAGSDEALVQAAHLQSLPTHGHARSMVTCAFYCLVARALLEQHAEPWAIADVRLEEVYKTWGGQGAPQTFLAELDVLRAFPKSNSSRGTGYVLDSIWSAREALRQESFEEVIRAAVLFGNDTDTTAAIAGGLAGIRFGLTGVPSRWLNQLRGFELVVPMTSHFVARV